MWEIADFGARCLNEQIYTSRKKVNVLEMNFGKTKKIKNK